MEKRTRRKMKERSERESRQGRGPVGQADAASVAEEVAGPPERTCFNCIHLMRPARLESFRQMMVPQVLLPICINHPDSPGQMREVHPCKTCRNFQAKWQPPVRAKPPEPPSEDVRYIPLTKNLFATVDAADYAWLSRHKWCVLNNGGGRYYACRSSGGKTVLMHRVIVNARPGEVVDHIDGNELNDRRNNLRICSKAQNAYNMRPRRGKTSRFRGVYRRKRSDRWYAAVSHKGVSYPLGHFDSEIEAARARDAKAVELYGEHTYLNFPEEWIRGEDGTYRPATQGP
jgi:hypothetical protein